MSILDGRGGFPKLRGYSSPNGFGNIGEGRVLRSERFPLTDATLLYIHLIYHDMDESTLRDKLDVRYVRILRAIQERGGTATTTEIKRLTGIETNQIITQRMDRLQEMGLVTTSYRQDQSRTEQLPTKVATFTSRGRQLATGGLLDEFSGRNQIQSVSQVNDRLDELERQVEALKDEVSDLSEGVNNGSESPSWDV